MTALGPSRPTFQEETSLFPQGYRLIAGIDEAGRGPIAGPVVAAAVILPQGISVPWLREVNDSKLLSPVKREHLAPLIKNEATAWAIGVSSPAEIDELNILVATRLAMARALECLHIQPQFLLVDAVRLSYRDIPCKAIIHGDALCISIAAASIVAKVARDQMMRELDTRYPGYDFARHKGYPTPDHVKRLKSLGLTSIHRRSFTPVRQMVDGHHARA